MWQLFKEPIQKEYYAKSLSRSWLLSVACCLFAFITPLLILISVGYSWDTYTLTLYEPVLTLQNYQSTCLQSTGTAIYDSSFSNQLSAKSYQSYVSAGGEGSDLVVSGSFTPTGITACTILLYFQVTIANRMPTIAVLPINFYKDTTSTALFITSVSQTGTVEAKLTYSLPQSSVDSGQGLLYYTNGSQSLSMTDTHLSYATNKNMSIVPSISSSQINYGTAASSVTYQGRFTVVASNYLEELTLLQNLRTLVPFYIYLLVLAWFFMAEPTVRWMLENKIYRSKVSHHKIKQH